jgi:hypothetical protein
VPRYEHHECCEDPAHIENFEDLKLDEELVDGLEGIKRLLQNWGSEQGLLITVNDPTMLSDSCNLPIKSRVMEDGRHHWSRRDPVHMTSAAYQNLATFISDSVLAMDPIESASAYETSTGLLKRRWAESESMPLGNNHRWAPYSLKG